MRWDEVRVREGPLLSEGMLPVSRTGQTAPGGIAHGAPRFFTVVKQWQRIRCAKKASDRSMGGQRVRMGLGGAICMQRCYLQRIRDWGPRLWSPTVMLHRAGLPCLRFTPCLTCLSLILAPRDLQVHGPSNQEGRWALHGLLLGHAYLPAPSCLLEYLGLKVRPQDCRPEPSP